ncbi:MAG: DUF7557 family protein [Candidatus Saliniplasma sp.]
MGRTTIAVKKETKNELKHLGRKGESYDDIIDRLLKLSKDELKLIEEVYRRIDKTDRREYVDLDEI